MRTKIIAESSNDVRQSRWTLIQADDRTLHVQQDAEYPDSDRKTRIVTLNEFMLENGPPPRRVQELIDRMFEEP